VPATKTIRTKLVEVVLTLVVPGWIAMAIVIFSFYQQERTHLLQNTLAISRALISAVDQELGSTTVAAQVLAASPSLRSDDLAGFHREASEVASAVLGGNFVLSERSGQQLVNTFRPYGEPLPPRGNPAPQRQAFETGKPVVGDLFIGPVIKIPFISIVVPVFQDEKVKYTLGVGIYPERFNEILRRQQLPPNWIAVILDKSGVIVARTHGAEVFTGKKAALTALTAMSEQSDGTAEITTKEGIPAISAFSRSAVSNWTVAIAIPVVEMPAVSSSYLIFSVLAATIILVIGLLFAGYQSTQIAHAIKGLIPPALALGFGNAPIIPKLKITEADEVAQALDRAYHLLRRRTSERDHALRSEVEMQVATKIQDEFVATVSHELRTPLTSISGALALLAGGVGGPLPEGASRLITIAHSNAQRLLRLVNDILDIAKFASGDMTFDTVPVDLRSAVEQAIEANRGFADQHGAHIELRRGLGCIVLSDVDRLMQVVTNLLSNAIKFSPPGGVVEVVVERRGEYGRVSVRDHGPGIPAAFRGHIFEKFAQAETGDAKQKSGSGLGLHIVKNFVTQQNGLVGFENAPDGGAMFFAELPLLNGDAAAGLAKAPQADTSNAFTARAANAE
jgi:two-component system, sensor histidine kinase and response regulator